MCSGRGGNRIDIRGCIVTKCAIQRHERLHRLMWMLCDVDVDEVRSLGLYGNDVASDWMLESQHHEKAGV